jgi:hypothetical protein
MPMGASHSRKTHCLLAKEACTVSLGAAAALRPPQVEGMITR